MDLLQQDGVTKMMKQVLFLVIHVSKDVSGLQHLQVSLKNMRNETGRNAAALAVAVGLKAARMETQENEKVEPASVWWAANNIGYTKLATQYPQDSAQ
jgi:DNA-binding XRE family transcriptional regulator